MLKTLSVAAVMTLWLFIIAAAPTSAQEPAVTTAVAPIFPRLASTVNASGNVLVEVKIDRTGSVVSKSVIGGHPLFYEAAQNAAQFWRFAASAGEESRTVRLTFVFSLLTDATETELTPVFTPPYQVEVKHLVPPHIDVNEPPGQSVSKKQKIKAPVQTARDNKAPAAVRYTGLLIGKAKQVRVRSAARKGENLSMQGKRSGW
jgi:TonB family protein